MWGQGTEPGSPARAASALKLNYISTPIRNILGIAESSAYKGCLAVSCGFMEALRGMRELNRFLATPALGV